MNQVTEIKSQNNSSTFLKDAKVDTKEYVFLDGEGEHQICDVSDGNFQGAAEEWYSTVYAEESTDWYDYYVYEKDALVDGNLDTDNYDAIHEGTITIHPTEPTCDDDRGHNWDARQDIEGGLAENPGVWGHSGGVKINEHCTRCNATKSKDTWAQRSDTGEQGLTSISYGTGDHHIEEDDED